MRPPGAAPDPGVEANARLTGSIAVVLLALLAADFATGLIVRRVLLSHALIGFLLIPAVLLKLGSVGYGFIRHYTGDRRLRIAGPPRLLAGLLGPGSVARRSLVVGSLLLGAVLAIAMLPFPTPFALPSGGG